MQKDLCFNCIHYWGERSCDAFPDEIPKEIIVGDDNHEKPHPQQENDLVFTPKKGKKKKDRR
jgi:hypothetical protein